MVTSVRCCVHRTVWDGGGTGIAAPWSRRERVVLERCHAATLDGLRWRFLVKHQVLDVDLNSKISS
jgi:hypothetical protein